MHYNRQQIGRSSKAKLEMQILVNMQQTWKRLYSAAAAAADDEENDDDDIFSACW
jgi:hypothetical protein